MIIQRRLGRGGLSINSHDSGPVESGSLGGNNEQFMQQMEAFLRGYHLFFLKKKSSREKVDSHQCDIDFLPLRM